MNEGAERAAVVAEARKWVGTPYRSNTGVLGVGCDCGFLLRECFVGAGLVEPFPIAPYAQDFHLHCREGDERYLGYVTPHLRQVEMSALGLGDVLMFKIGHVYSHGGIVTSLEPMFMVHAHIRVRCVAEDRVRANMGFLQAKYLPRAYTRWGLA